jgi:hypothetical protein
MLKGAASAGTLVAMFASFVALAGPASAHANSVTGVASCEQDGTYSVTWTVANDYALTETATVTGHSPSASTLSTTIVSIGNNGTGSVVQSSIAGSSTSATLDVHGVWSDGYGNNPGEGLASGTVSLDGTCVQNIPVPAAPQPTAPTCAVDGVLVVPTDTAQVHWTSSPGGTGPGTYTVTAWAQAGYGFSDGATKQTYTETVLPKGSGLDCNQEVLPVTPSLVEASCDHASGTTSSPTLTLPATSGIVYTTSGTVASGQTVNVTATAQAGSEFKAGDTPSGWTFVDSTHETWTHLFVNLTCDVYVTPARPGFTDAQCTGTPGMEGDASYVITAQAGVVYSPTPGSYSLAPGQSVTVTATPAAGYAFNGASSSWTFTATVLDCSSAVSPVAPAVVQATCDHGTGVVSGFTITPATTAGITYSVNGLVVTATPDKGYRLGTLPDGWTGNSESATFTAVRNDAQCDVYVTPARPGFTDAQCTGTPGMEGDASYVITAQAGVVYSPTPGSYSLAPGQSVTVTATPAAGYAFNGASSSWTFTATVLDCRVPVTPVAPAVTQAVCDGPGHSTLPSVVPADTVGVTYTVSVDLSTVTATRTDGYAWKAPLPGGWVLNKDGTAAFATSLVSPGDCLAGVTAVTPAFSDNTCQAGAPVGASYTLPVATGITYTVDGLTRGAGSYTATDASTVVVTASAQHGYTLTGTTTWSHTFPATPTCLGVDAVTAQQPPASTTGGLASTGALASTGVSVVWITLLGGLMALAGASLCIGATDRRWFQR